METLQELVYRLARELHQKNETRLATAGLTPDQNKDMRETHRRFVIDFVERNLHLDHAEAQRLVDSEIIHTVH